MSGIEVMEAMTAAYNAKDLDAMMELVTDNCIMQKERGEVLVGGKIALMHYFSVDYKNVGDIF